MNRDDIIRMAREAGLERIVGVYADGSRIVEVTNLDLLESFAELVAAAEREACAQVCEAEGERVDASWVSCAFAIRERGAP